MKFNVAIIAALATIGLAGSFWGADDARASDGDYWYDPYLMEAGLGPCPEGYFIRQAYEDPLYLKFCDTRKYTNSGVRDQLLANQLLDALALAEEAQHPARALIAVDVAAVLFDLERRNSALRVLKRHVDASTDVALLQQAQVYRMAAAMLPNPTHAQLEAFEAFLDEIAPAPAAEPGMAQQEALMAGWRISGHAWLDVGEPALAEKAFMRLAAYSEAGAQRHQGYAVNAWRELAWISFHRGDLAAALERIERAETAAGYTLGSEDEPKGALRTDTSGVVFLRVQIELARGKTTSELFPGELLGEEGDDWRLQLDWNIDFDGETQERREQMLTLLRRIHQDRGLPDLSEGFGIPDMPQLVPTAFEQAQSLAVGRSDEAATFANALRQLEFEEDRVRLEEYDKVRSRYFRNLNRYAEVSVEAGPAASLAILQEISRDREQLAQTTDFDTAYDDYPGQELRYDSILPWYLGLRQWKDRGQTEDMLLIVPADGDIHVFVQGWTGKTGFAWHVLEDGVAKIAPLVDRLRCQVDVKSCTDEAEFALVEMPVSPSEENGQMAYDQAAAYEIYRLLIKPVEPALTKGSDVFVMASGAMATLPLAMLVTEAPEEDYDWADYRTMRRAPWLGNRYAFTTTPSFESFRPNRLKPINNVSRDMLFAVADPAFDGQLRPGELRSADFLTLTREGRLANLEAIRKLSPLPGTKAEYEAVRSALQTSEHVALLGTRATEAALRQHPDLDDARYLLLATHGLLPGQNDRGLAEPALVLTPPDDATSENDGLLTASEVRSLNLRAEWVFLSACNTANAGGTGDSLSALASAFLRAGALQVMASHWPVLDDVTPALTTATLRASARNRRGGPGRALQAATRAVREGRWPGGGRIEGWQESWAHPMAWAPFVLISNGDEAIVNERFDTDWN